MPLTTQEDINEKKAMLNVLRDVGSAVTSQKKTRGKAKQQIEPAEIDQLCAHVSAALWSAAESLSRGGCRAQMIRCLAS